MSYGLPPGDEKCLLQFEGAQSAVSRKPRQKDIRISSAPTALSICTDINSAVNTSAAATAAEVERL